MKREVTSEVLRILGVELFVQGPLPSPDEANLVVANHRTALDIGVLMSQVGGAFLSRSDLAEWPIAGPLAKHATTIFVQRDDRRSGAKAIREIRRRLEQRETVIVFPEGTTHRGDVVHEFKSGSFAALRGIRANVVPVGIAYPDGTEYVGNSFGEHVRDIASRVRTPVVATFGNSFEAGAKRDQLALQAHESVQELTHESRRALDLRL